MTLYITFKNNQRGLTLLKRRITLSPLGEIVYELDGVKEMNFKP